MDTHNNTAPKTTPMDFFMWLGAMATLYVSAVSLITLLFEYINRLFPDNLSGYVDPFSGAIRFAIASLVVLFPLYLFLTRRINKDLREHPGKRGLAVRRWLIHITLFVAGITLVVDLIVLINTFLGGDLTTQFLLKVLVVFVVIGGAFLYYLADLKGRWEKEEGQSKLIGVVVAAVVLLSIVSGFFIIGSPSEQRELRFDGERVRDLQTIQSQLTSYWQQKGEIPQSLEALADPVVGFNTPVDPETGEPYGYRVLEERTFELCATFGQPSPESSRVESIAYPRGAIGQNWQHGAGEECFTRTIDPEFFPVRKTAL